MLKTISDLKRSEPKRRLVLLDRMRAKNLEFFKKNNPELAGYLEEAGTGRYEIRITRTSIEITDKQTGQPCHPPGELFSYMAEFGSWHHSGWIDKIILPPVLRGGVEHGQVVAGFVDELAATIPGIGGRLAKGLVALPKLEDGRRYSGAVLFLGIFTGLHIAAYLSKTVCRDMFLIEPDIERFGVSTYFLDYRLLEEKYGRIMLHVGDDTPQNPLDMLVQRAAVTSSVWVRMLPAYTGGKFDDTINRLGLRWRALTEVYVPFDRELRNLEYGAQNIRDGLPFIHLPPSLSANAAIAVVASGPSLENDLPWLRENQDKLIVMAAISAVRVLKNNGIRVDFQCTLDTEIEDHLMEKMELDTGVPLLAYYKIDPKLIAPFGKVFLVTESGKANPVRFKHEITYTHPTSGNLTTAVAVWAKPSTLIFIGMDLAFRDEKQSHVKGGYHDDDGGIYHQDDVGGRDKLVVKANFEESEGEILTMAYFNNARFGIEEAVASLGEAARQIINLSDGARIAGARAVRSAGLELPAYPEKARDKRAIMQAFSEDRGAIWQPYEAGGAALLEVFAGAVTGALAPEEGAGFDWPKWAIAMDRAWGLGLGACIEKHGDMRVEAYARLLHDLLAEWYRLALLTESPEEAGNLYRAGLRALKSTLGGLRWPEKLDGFGPEKPGGEPRLSS